MPSSVRRAPPPLQSLTARRWPDGYRDSADALADQLEAGCVHVILPHVVLTVEGLEVPPLQAVSDKQLAYARAVRASAVHGFLRAMLARGAKIPRSNVEEQMPMLAGWVQTLLRSETASRYWLDGQARAAPDIGVVGEAFRAARTAKVEMPAVPLLHIDLAWP
ncbi:hypothetical protein HRD49_42545 [Corallococcus exiguus]|nr:hypothetical protein [Corallococcus exiguus]